MQLQLSYLAGPVGSNLGPSKNTGRCLVRERAQSSQAEPLGAKSSFTPRALAVPSQLLHAASGPWCPHSAVPGMMPSHPLPDGVDAVPRPGSCTAGRASRAQQSWMFSRLQPHPIEVSGKLWLAALRAGSGPNSIAQAEEKPGCREGAGRRGMVTLHWGTTPSSSTALCASLAGRPAPECLHTVLCYL